MAGLKDENEERRQLANECMDEGLQHIYAGRIKAAEEMLTRAKYIFEEIGERRQLATSLNILSITYEEMGNESMDIDCLLDALDIAHTDDAFDLAAKYENNMGSKFMRVRAFDKALVYFRRALEMYNLACEKGQISLETSRNFNLILNLNISATYYMLGDYEHARVHYEKAKAEMDYPENEERRFTFMTFEGLLLWRLGREEESKACVGPIMKLLEETEYATDYFETTSDILEMLEAMGDYERWEEALKIIEGRLNKDGGLNFSLEIQRQWLEFYEKTGNREKYAEACIKYYELSKAKVELDNRQAAATIELKIDMRRADKQKKLADTMVYVDTLTGVGNRNKMLTDSKIFILDSLAKHSPLAVGLIDVDYFKECNDSYGHIKGDECLRKVADAINRALEGKGSLYRYGGDELLLLIPDVSVEEILEIGKRIKENVAELKIPNEKSPISEYVTVSQGYTRAIAEQNDTIEQLVNLADLVLYSVKRCGRNDYRFAPMGDVISGRI